MATVESSGGTPGPHHLSHKKLEDEADEVDPDWYLYISVSSSKFDV